MKILILMAFVMEKNIIREQIDFITNRTFKDQKLIIRDDGFKDKTSEILNDYKKIKTKKKLKIR